MFTILIIWIYDKLVKVLSRSNYVVIVNIFIVKYYDPQYIKFQHVLENHILI
jgi:hypothetical protein